LKGKRKKRGGEVHERGGTKGRKKGKGRKKNGKKEEQPLSG